MPPNIKALIFSMLTAIMTGGIIALLFIFIHIYFFKVDQNLVLLEEGKEDPILIQKFSRISTYSADDSREIIENVKNSISNKDNHKISALSYIVMDTKRNVIILEKDSDKAMPIASITKLITAVIARKILNQEDYIIISRQILNTYGNEARLREGEKLKVKELIYPLLMVSSNDASEALAQRYSRKEFIKEMNNWVNNIGAYHTYFKDPSGLSSENVSTTKDLSIIIKWILENDPEIFNITLLKEKTIRTHTWINQTHFLNLTSYAGGKNGYTSEAHRTSASLFKFGKQESLYAVLLLGSSDRDNDILNLLDKAVY